MVARTLWSQEENQAEPKNFCIKTCFSGISNQNWEGLLSTRHFAGFVCTGVGVGAQRAAEGIGAGVV